VGLRTGELSGFEGLAPAKPKLLARSTSDNSSVPDNMFTTVRMPYGLEAVDMYYDDAATNARAVRIGAVGFTSSLGNLGGADASQQVNVLPIPSSQLNKPKADGVAKINANIINGVVNPDGGVHICLKSGTTKQSALFSIGGEGRQTSVDVAVFSSGNCT
jgi:hypothetical protein